MLQEIFSLTDKTVNLLKNKWKLIQKILLLNTVLSNTPCNDNHFIVAKMFRKTKSPTINIYRKKSITDNIHIARIFSFSVYKLNLSSI